MKAILKNMLLAYSGKCDGLVFYYNPRLDRVLVRTIPKWKPTENNHRLARIARNLKALGLSEGFRLDLITYTEMYRREYRENSVNSWYNLFNRMMWNLAKNYSLEGSPLAPDGTPPAGETAIDLETLNRAQITAGNLPCASVKQAVEAGLLLPVPGYERLDGAM
ncbi:MAG: hypothetical protein K0B87_01095 [Candidatus Syntrophosphaera sp.]|nr:hypothetical protein [Candidatus Syntrophosphaera sp.]